MNVELYDVIVHPHITEKISKDTEKYRKYAFEVHKQANKKQIKSAVEKIYNVHVTQVNTQMTRGKWRRVRHQPGMTASWKKAIVTLKEGDKIDITA
jgi:large subunit ribosomal protein L23